MFEAGIEDCTSTKIFQDPAYVFFVRNNDYPVVCKIPFTHEKTRTRIPKFARFISRTKFKSPTLKIEERWGYVDTAPAGTQNSILEGTYRSRFGIVALACCVGPR